MQWQEISWVVRAEDRDVLEEILQEHDVLAISASGADNEAVFESSPVDAAVWSRVRVTALLAAQRDLQPLCTAVHAALGARVGDRQERRFEDRDWIAEWSRALEPQCFADRLWVVPRHRRPPPDAQRVVFMDPGLAFGSGTHETTRMCLDWLVRADLQGREVLDYSCGSGLLGIAALVCGAAGVVACDTDPLALQVTRDNARHNAVLPLLTAGLPKEIADRTGDVLLANILLDALLDYAPHFARSVRSGGTLLLSGILDRQLETVLEAYGAAFEEFDVRRSGEWVCVVCRRRLTNDRGR